MIGRIQGRVVEKGEDFLLIENQGLSYEVFLPQNVMQRIAEIQDESGCVKLVTYHYHQVEPSRSIPVLFGFLNVVERDFFQQFIKVSGIGPRAALRALNKPISVIAQAIDEGSIDFLKSLPGIGQQRAKEIVAKLQGKVGKFGLIQDSRRIQEDNEKKSIVNDALEVLMQLQYKKSEARAMIDRAMEDVPEIATHEDLLNVIYKQYRQDKNN